MSYDAISDEARHLGDHSEVGASTIADVPANTISCMRADAIPVMITDH